MSGGSRSDQTTLPKFYETALQQQVGMAQDASQAGYVPYYGPDVAAFSPLQQASFQGTDMMASAFGMPTTGGGQYMPEARDFGGGLLGYSSAPAFEQAQAELGMRRPGQAQYIESFTVDPVTGQPGTRAATMQPVELEMQGGSRGK